jgi:hypothetical protein
MDAIHISEDVANDGESWMRLYHHETGLYHNFSN